MRGRWTKRILAVYFVLFLLFLFWHLADFTWGWVNPDFVRGAVYRNVDASLSRIPVAILYVVANIALGLHLFHGAWSMFQSLGVNNPKYNALRRGFAVGFAAYVLVLNLSFPIAVVTGIALVRTRAQAACRRRRSPGRPARRSRPPRPGPRRPFRAARSPA